MEVNTTTVPGAGGQVSPHLGQTEAVKSAGIATEINKKVERTEDKAPTEKTSTENMQEIISELNDQAAELNTGVRFGFNDDIDGMVVTVYEKETNDVIRKIPSEEAVSLMTKMKEVVGIIFDKKG